jgi:proteic killer suppression protein
LDVYFKNSKLEKELSTEAKLNKTHGSKRAQKIRVRLADLRAAPTLMELGPPYKHPARCHELVGNRKGQLSVDLDHPYRLIFVPDHDPIPKLENGGLDWSKVTAIRIEGIENTHD